MRRWRKCNFFRCEFKRRDVSSKMFFWGDIALLKLTNTLSDCVKQLFIFVYHRLLTDLRRICRSKALRWWSCWGRPASGVHSSWRTFCCRCHRQRKHRSYGDTVCYRHRLVDRRRSQHIVCPMNRWRLCKDYLQKTKTEEVRESLERSWQDPRREKTAAALRSYFKFP